MAGTYNFTINQRDKIIKQFYWLDANHVPVDLSTYNASFVIYNPNTLASILTLINTGTSPGLVITGTSGLITLTITTTQSTLLTFDFAKYYLQVVSSTITKKLLEGWITNKRT